jgi:hypothetical protein
MTRPPTIRRRFLAACSIAAIVTILPATAANAAIAEARRPVRPSARPSDRDVPNRICDYDWRDGTWQIRQLIRCAAQRWTVPGGVAMALAIADRESHFEPHAYNPSGCAGIYQHQLRYWPGRAAAYGFRGWSAFNARANIMVTMRMVHLSGWGPWAL